MGVYVRQQCAIKDARNRPSVCGHAKQHSTAAATSVVNDAVPGNAKQLSARPRNASSDLWVQRVILMKASKLSTSVLDLVVVLSNAVTTLVLSFAIKALVVHAEKPSSTRSAVTAGELCFSLLYRVAQLRHRVVMIAKDRRIVAIPGYRTTATAKYRNALNVLSCRRSLACAGRRD